MASLLWNDTCAPPRGQNFTLRMMTTRYSNPNEVNPWALLAWWWVSSRNLNKMSVLIDDQGQTSATGRCATNQIWIYSTELRIYLEEMLNRIDSKWFWGFLCYKTSIRHVNSFVIEIVTITMGILKAQWVSWILRALIGCQKYKRTTPMYSVAYYERK